MPLEPNQFASIAKPIARGDRPLSSFPAEVRARTAVGRAYYAAFLAVRTKVREAGGQPTHGREDRIRHGGLTDVLFSSGVDDLIAIGKVLDDLYQFRRQADYVLVPTGRWNACTRPSTAEQKAKIALGLIKRLPATDFSPLVGKI